MKDKFCTLLNFNYTLLNVNYMLSNNYCTLHKVNCARLYVRRKLQVIMRVLYVIDPVIIRFLSGKIIYGLLI